VTHLAAALFFTLALLAAMVALHMTVRLYWAEILLALRGELGRGAGFRIVPATPPAGPAPYAAARRRAAF
jgi:hypothetical protein